MKFGVMPHKILNLQNHTSFDLGDYRYHYRLISPKSGSSNNKDSWFNHCEKWCEENLAGEFVLLKKAKTHRQEHDTCWVFISNENDHAALQLGGLLDQCILPQDRFK